MSELRDLIIRWQRGWSVARELPAAEDVSGVGLRSRCSQPGREVEYVALDRDPTSLTSLAERVAGESAVTWLTVPTTEPAVAISAFAASGLVLLRRSELLMTIDLRRHRHGTPVLPYRVSTQVSSRREGLVIAATVEDESGDVGARGTMGVDGADATADRIETMPAHRRKGLATGIMSALVHSAIKQGAEHGILIASEEGQHLYTALGWQPVAEVLIAATPDNTHRSGTAQPNGGIPERDRP